MGRIKKRRIIMTLKELLKGREKLRKYDELNATLNSFQSIKEQINAKDFKAFATTNVLVDEKRFGVYLTAASLDAIISALEGEIAKLDEE